MSLFNINYHKIASINIFSYQEYDVCQGNLLDNKRKA